MNPSIGRKWLPTAVALLLFAGIFTPIAVLGQTGSPSQGQLAALITAAESSRTYAESTVALATAHGLSVQAAQAQLTQGDSLLATAKADAQSGTNPAEGIAAVQAAMSDYAGASASASAALENAHLTAGVDYRAAIVAVTEVNATVSLAASVAAEACGSIAVSSSNSPALAQACAQVGAQVAAARSHLSEADSLLIQASGQTGATVDLSPALTLVAQARAEANASMTALLSVSSFGYAQRARAYVNAVITPLSARANATIRAEESFLANLTTFQITFATQSSARAATMTSVMSSAQDLATVIAAVNVGAVSSSITASESTAAQVKSDMTTLLALPGISVLTNVAADIQASIADTDSYTSSMAAADAQSQAYSQTRLSAFSIYLGALNADSAAVQTSGSAYVLAYQKVITDLQALLTVSGVQAIYDSLNGLQVSATEGGVNTSIQQETSAMGTVQTDYEVLYNGISASGSTVLVPSMTLTTAASFSAQGSGFLNSTASAAMGEVSAQVQATAQAAESFEAQANATTSATVSAFASSASTLSGKVADVTAQTQTALTANANAVAYASSDTRARISEAGSGQAYVSQALSLFASQDVSGGATAMAQASLELQAASEASA